MRPPSLACLSLVNGILFGVIETPVYKTTMRGPSSPKLCENITLQIDQACLAVQEEADISEVLAQSAECLGCLPWTVWKKEEDVENDDINLAVNTSFATILTVRRRNEEDGNDSFCTVTHHFGQFGEYLLAVDDTTCRLSIVEEARNAFLPILYVFLFLVSLKLVWTALMRVYGTRTFRHRWIFLRFGVPMEIQRDLSGLPATTPARASASPSGVLGQGDVDSDRSFLISPAASGPPRTPIFRGRQEQDDVDPPSPAASPQADLAAAEAAATKRGRVKSLDVMRGISIAVMIFVNYGGGGYWFFRHSAWNGLTVADLVFPWFMWIMGLSLALSVQSQLRKSVPRKVIAWRILKRSVILFMLGLFLNSGGKNDLMKLRIPGVLQRFAVTYLMAGTLEAALMRIEDHHQSLATTCCSRWTLYFRDLVQSRLQWLLVLFAVALHTCLTFLLPFPGCPVGYIGPGGLHDGGIYAPCTGGSAQYIDVAIFGKSHIYQRPTARLIYDTSVPFDPEGLLGTLTSLLVVFLGVQCGKTMLAFPDWRDRIGRWSVWAVVLGLAAGALCGFSKEGGLIPVNKNLWSVSFCLATTAMAYLLFSVVYLAVDVSRVWSGSPFLYAGMNSILLFVGHELCSGYIPFSWRPFSISHTELLVMNIWGTSVWLFASYYLYKRRLFLSL